MILDLEGHVKTRHSGRLQKCLYTERTSVSHKNKSLITTVQTGFTERTIHITLTMVSTLHGQLLGAYLNAAI